MDMSKTGAEQHVEDMAKIGFIKRGTNRVGGEVVSERYVHRQLNIQVEYWIKNNQYQLTGEFGEKDFFEMSELQYYVAQKKANA